jgi:hypothetical protein
MPGREPTKQALSRLQEVGGMIRKGQGKGRSLYVARGALRQTHAHIVERVIGYARASLPARADRFRVRG